MHCFQCLSLFRHVCKSFLRGCLKRPQRLPNALAGNSIDECIDCENTRKYVKSSVELFHHFSNPSLNRRWICDKCESDNNSVTWHCLVCDTVSYLAPIYRETLHHPKQLIVLDSANGSHQLNDQISNNSACIGNNNNHINNRNEHSQPASVHHPLGTKKTVINPCLKSTKRQQFHQQNNKNLKSFYLRRTQSLTADKSSYSCRSCYNCFVNNRKNIFKLPELPFINYYKATGGCNGSPGIGIFSINCSSDDLFGRLKY